MTARHHRWTIVLLSTFLVLVLVEHVVAELDPLQSTVSEYANAWSGWLMTPAFLAWALASASLAVRAMRPDAPDAPDAGVPLWHAALMAVAAASTALLTFAHTQAVQAAVPATTTRTTEGRLHDIGSGLLTVALLGSATALVWRSPRHVRHAVVVLLAIGVGTTAVLLAIGDPVPGARQRVLIVAGVGVQAILSRVLAQHPGSTSQAAVSPSDGAATGSA